MNAPTPLDQLRGTPKPQQEPMSRRGAPVAALAGPVAPEAAMPTISLGFADLQSWEFTQRVARGYASSTMVPDQYRLWVAKQRWKPENLTENPNAIPNCIVALNMASRLQVDALAVMQNLYVIEGRPSWSSQFVLSRINDSGRFSTELQFEIVKGPLTKYKWTESYYENGMKTRDHVFELPALSCVAWAISKSTGQRVESPMVTMELAVAEGWYGKKGSKWKTMPELMIRYRAGAFFGRLFCSDLLMGLRTVEETQDIIDTQINADGVYEATVEQGEAQAETIQPGAEAGQGGDAAAEQKEPRQDMPQVEHEQTISIDLGAPVGEKATADLDKPAEAQTTFTRQTASEIPDGFGDME